MTNAIRPRRTQPFPDFSAGPTDSKPRPKASRSASGSVPSALTRASRLVANAWRSGDPGLAFEALRFHCQEPLHAFLLAGGRVTRRSVEYGDASVDRAPFIGPNLAGVAYLRRFVDFGGRISKRDDLYVIGL